MSKQTNQDNKKLADYKLVSPFEERIKEVHFETQIRRNF